MPLTKQILTDVVRQEIKSELIPINQKLGHLDERVASLNQKIDNLTNIVTNAAGQFKKFDEEQVVLSGQVSDLTDRVEKLELARI